MLRDVTLGTSGLALGCGAATVEPTPSPVEPRPGEANGPLARIARTHEPVPLPFDPTSLDGLSERLIRSHHENNYAGAVRKLNQCREQLAAANADTPGFLFGGLARSELVFANSVLLHELYFANLGPDGGDPPASFGELVQGTFGDLAGWEADFRRCAMSLAGGSGWVIVAYDRHRSELAHRVCSDHGHAGAFDVPLLVLDMYEHSYHLDHGADAARYVEAFVANVEWAAVEARVSLATSRASG